MAWPLAELHVPTLVVKANAKLPNAGLFGPGHGGFPFHGLSAILENSSLSAITPQNVSGRRRPAVWQTRSMKPLPHCKTGRTVDEKAASPTRGKCLFPASRSSLFTASDKRRLRSPVSCILRSNGLNHHEGAKGSFARRHFRLLRACGCVIKCSMTKTARIDRRTALRVSVVLQPGRSPCSSSWSAWAQSELLKSAFSHPQVSGTLERLGPTRPERIAGPGAPWKPVLHIYDTRKERIYESGFAST